MTSPSLCQTIKTQLRLIDGVDYRGSATSGAVFSKDEAHRYLLWREWDPKLRPVLHVLLNPSTADEVDNDPTIARRITHIREHWALGATFGSAIIANAFALRSTDPKALYTAVDPLGVHNDRLISMMAAQVYKRGGIVLCGWSNHAKLLHRHDRLLCLLGATQLHALKLNAGNYPAHPLYLGYHLQPREWDWRAGTLR